MEFVKLKEVVKYRREFFEIDDGDSYKRCRVQLHRRGVRLRDIIKGADIKTKKQRLCKKHDLIIAEMDAKFGGYGIIPDDLDGAIVSGHYYLYELDQNRLIPEFMEVVIDSGAIQDQIKAVGSTNYSRISAKEVLEYKIPCPPINAQKNVVSFYSKNKANGKKLLTELELQQNLIKKLRQQILQDAIEGKLTADWRKNNPDVEPASELLKRIAAEKQQLIKDKKIRKQKPLPPITDDEKPFELSEGWEWCRFQDITSVITCGIASTPKYHPSGRIFLSAKNVKPYKFMPDDHKYVDEETYQKIIKNSKPELNDILLTRVGAGIGEAAIINQEIDFAFYVSLTLIKPLHKYMNSKYLLNFLNSNIGIKNAITYTTGKKSSQGNLNVNHVRPFLIPVPPMLEQQTIVTKVEKLLAVCDQLETQITTNQTHTNQLLQAVLKEAFQN